MSKIKEIERLKELKQETEELNEKIIKYSVYPSLALASSFAKLLTEFENEYYSISENLFTIEKVISNYRQAFTLKDNIENYSKYVGVSFEQTVFCPKNFRNETDYYEKLKLPKYIYDFIDYTFQKRVERNLINITSEELDEILNEYIKNVTEETKKKANQVKEEQELKERTDFEQTCMVDRESFFDAIVDIITNSGEKATSRTHYDKQLDKNAKKDTFLLSHSIYILANGRLRDFKVLLDKIEIPKEKEEKIQIDSKKQPYVNFFEVKNYFSYAYENINSFHIFMNEIESLFKEKRILEKSDVDSIEVNKKGANKIKEKNKNIGE